MTDVAKLIGKIGQAKDCPTPGIYPDVPQDEYRKWNAWNWSTLWNARRCMEKVQYAKANPDTDKAEHFIDGDLFHKYLLQPLLVPVHYAFRPGQYVAIEKSGDEPCTIEAIKEGEKRKNKAILMFEKNKAQKTV